MGKLTTHVLDTAQGCPAEGVKVTLFGIGSGQQNTARTELANATTNADGRLASPILQDQAFEKGIYELVFEAGAYFRDSSLDIPDPAFIDQVLIRFGIASPDQNYHVPLLVSPWSYSTYRGS